MSRPHFIVALHSAADTRVLDVRTLPEEVKCEIMMAAFVVATHFGNGDIEAPPGSFQLEAFTALSKATDAIDPYMQRLPGPPPR